MKFVVDPAYASSGNKILEILEDFENAGSLYGKGDRNKIKLFDFLNGKLNVKYFKIPNAVNKMAYRFFRKSKAQRSFEYAQNLIKLGIGTPAPVAFAEEKLALSLRRSFYVSQHLEYDLTYRELVTQSDYPNHEEILRAFTGFTYKLHENNIEFLDHSPGNTLIQTTGRDYRFYLVDLNRMNFKKLGFDDRMKNFSRLTPKKEMVVIMANEYSKICGEPEAQVFEKMWKYTKEFQEKFQRKQRLKKKLKFWKNN